MVARDPALAHEANEQGTTALLAAIYTNRREVADAMLASGMELNVFEAAATGRTDRVRALVAADSKLANAYAPDGFFPLGLAAFFGHAETVSVLLEAGADPNAAAHNQLKAAPIHSAAAAGRADIVKMLLERGANANARQQQGFVALHTAAFEGKLEIARLLLDHGADPNAAADDGRTPLAFAREGKHDDLARLIAERGGK